LESNDEFQKLGGANAKVTEALQTYNIDRVKDVILANPEKYGLMAGIDMQDLTKLSVDDLKNIKWGEALNDSIQEKGGLIANLPQEKIDSIVQNNSILKEFFENNPEAPRMVGNYEAILRGEGNTGVVSESRYKPNINKEYILGQKFRPEGEDWLKKYDTIGKNLDIKEKIGALNKDLTDFENQYKQARLDLAEARVNSYTSDLPKEEINKNIDSAYNKVDNLEKQIEELKSSKIKLEETLKNQTSIIEPEVKQPTKGIIETKTELPKEKLDSILSSEKQTHFDNLINSIKSKSVDSGDVDKLIQMIKSEKVAVEDFSKYYAGKIGAENLNPQLKSNMEMNFKIIMGENTEEVKKFVAENSAYGKNAKNAAVNTIKIFLERIRR